MSLVNIFITGIASLFVALEPDKTRVKGNFFRNVVERAFSAGFFMFVPVSLGITYFVISSIVKSGGYDMEYLKSVFENGEIVSIGWVPTISLCVAIAGFIIFFDDCRPFTTFRKILYGCTLGIVLIILYLAPEYFIISGTDMLEFTGGAGNIPHYVLTHIGRNATLALYRTMTLEQGIFILVFTLAAYPLYRINKKFTLFAFRRIFSSRDFRDE